MKKPVFKGNGNHSIRDLERLCNEYEEFCHQRQIERQQIEQRNKDQVEVLERLTFLNQCELEGLSSGQPTADQWRKAFEKAEQALKKAGAE